MNTSLHDLKDRNIHSTDAITFTGSLTLEPVNEGDEPHTHNSAVSITYSNETDHYKTVVAFADPYILTGKHKLTSADLIKAKYISQVYTSTSFTETATACSTATGITYQKIREALQTAMNKFVGLRLEYGLKEFIFFQGKEKTYVGVILRVQEKAGDNSVKEFIQISVPVY